MTTQVIGSMSSLKHSEKGKLSLERAKEILTKTNFNIDWLQNYQQALEKAVSTSGSDDLGRGLVLALFTGSDWCQFCQALEAEILQKFQFRLWFKTHLLTPFKADYPLSTEQPADIKEQNALLLQQYNITGYPTVVVIKTSPGYCTPSGCVVSTSEVGRITGFGPGTSVDDYIANLSAIAGIQ